MSISIIVNNFNGMKYLPRALETLSGQQHVKTEIIVVDRESTDGSLAYLAALPKITLLSEGASSGLAAGYAVGVKVARYDHLFFCNEDMWFDPMCLVRLLQHICLERRHGASDPWQWTYDGKAWIHGGVRFRKCVWDPNSPFPRRGFNFTESLPSGARVPIPCAGAFMIHRRMYDEIGGWDTSFFLDHEDVDLFLRGWQKDWYCVTVPDAKGYHAVGATNNQVLKNGQKVSERRYVSGRSNIAVVGLKYFSPLAAALWTPAVFVVPFAQNLLGLRLRHAKWDLQSFVLTMRRLESVLAYRRQHRPTNTNKPGELFFRQDDMLGSPAMDRRRANA